MDQFDLVIASRDWHPEESDHFYRWPSHCIRNTPGAAFPEDLNTEKIKEEFLKGTGQEDGGYSAFEATNADLDAYLKKRMVKQLYLAGLTTEYCVMATALEARRRGYETAVIAPAVAGVNMQPGDEVKALREMHMAGIRIIGAGLKNPAKHSGKKK
jgi:nicotinamidase/pyrazinamidase